METLIRYRVLLGLIWFCTVYLCPTKRTLGICGLIALYEKMSFSMSEKWRKAWCVIFFLGYFFLTTLDCLVSPAASLHMILSKKQKKALIRLRRCAGWSAPVLFTNPRRQGFSRPGPYYSCIYDPCNSEWTASHVFFLFFFFKFSSKVHSLLLNSFTFHLFYQAMFG